MTTSTTTLLRRLLIAGALALAFQLALSLSGLASDAHAADTPPGFTDSRVTGVGAPTALAFTPDERMLVTTQQGRLLVYKNDVLIQNPALDLGSAGKLCANGERGLLGVAVDPDFANNRFIYLYYTFNRYGGCPTSQVSNPVNRVSRFVLADNNVVSLGSEKVLIDNMPSYASNHNAGDVHFGKDGYLYATVGDGGCDYARDSGCAGNNDAARDPHVLLGKVLRVTRDGGIPPDNPYATTGDRCAATGFSGAQGKPCQETFASGLRNPFRFAFDPDAAGTRFFINDVGQGRYEEIDEGRAGADYGWSHCEGNYDNPDRPGIANCQASFTPPIHDYNRNVGASITGGAFVPDGVWPASYNNSYLFGDFVSGKIFKLDGGSTRSDFVTGLGGGSAVAMTFGPHNGSQALYYTTYAGGGEVRRVAYTDAPTAAVAARPEAFDPTPPYEFSFDGSESRDPNPGDTLTYLWDFGDGTKETTATPTTNNTYADPGTYNATLRVRDASGATSAAAEIRIDAGNDAPRPTITAPEATKLFRVGEEISLTGEATDPEDGVLDPSTLSWEVLRHHNDNHAHPYFSGKGNNLKFQAPPPEDLAATGPGNYLEVRLTATDSKGLKRTVSREIQPKTVELEFLTDPDGLQLEANGQRITAPRTLISWEGYGLNLNAPTQQDGAGRTFGFSSWSDGGAASHGVTTPAAPMTYKATFEEQPAPPPPPYVPPSPTPNYAAPTISRPSPPPGSSTRDRTPTISALVRDSQTDLTRTNVALFVDGRRVRFSYTQASDRLKYTPRSPLREGRHTVRVVANDGSVSNSRTWRFRITG